MSNGDHWMPLYIGDYMAATMHLSTLEHGVYLLLLMHYWQTGPLPEDDQSLAAIVKLELKAWKKLAPKIRKFFTPAAGSRARNIARAVLPALVLVEPALQVRDPLLQGRSCLGDGLGDERAAAGERLDEAALGEQAVDAQHGGLGDAVPSLLGQGR